MKQERRKPKIIKRKPIKLFEKQIKKRIPEPTPVNLIATLRPSINDTIRTPSFLSSLSTQSKCTSCGKTLTRPLESYTSKCNECSSKGTRK